MDNKSIEFFEEIGKLMQDIHDVIQRYEYEDRVLMLNIIGLIESFDEEHARMNTSFAFNIESEEELNELLSISKTAYLEKKKNDDDIDDLLNSFNISLN